MTAPFPVIPSHIPASRVYDFDYILAPAGSTHPHQQFSKQLRSEAPDIFYTPRNGGHWAVMRSSIAVDMFRQTENFSNDPKFNKAREWKPVLLPTQVDPPDHTEYRKTLATYFAPTMMRKLEPDFRQLAGEILDSIRPRGRCEFVEEVGEVFPISVFLRLVRAPMGDRLALLEMAQRHTRSPHLEVRAQAIADLATYIRSLCVERRKNPGDDVLSLMINSDFHGRPLNSDEQEGLGTLLFLAGLDTVKSVLSFITLYLARNPDQYRRLVADPNLVRTALEELLRISGTSNPERGVTHDLEYSGVTFKKNDRIVFLTPLMGFDEEAMDNPQNVDLDRKMSPHLIFGSGPHRCAGSHIARIEIRTFIEEWTRRFPSFGIDPASEVKIAGGTVWTPEVLPLVWPIS